MASIRLIVSSLAFATVVAGPELLAQCPGNYGSGSSGGGPQVHGRQTGNSTAPTSPTTPGPASPSTPGPSSPGPGGPTTPRSGGPTTPGAGPAIPTPGGPTTGGAGPSGGVALEFVRGDTSKKLLEVEWNYPVPERVDAQAMSFQRALRALRGDDPRPLLIVRECELCQGSSRALLDEGKNDERTKLMTRWFNCVKLPNHVWDPNHPFHQIFQGMQGSHLFICSWDGELKVPFNGVQPRPALWRGMYKVLNADYKKDAKRAVSKMVKHLEIYDRLDAKIKDATTQVDRALEYHGPKSSKYKKAVKRLKREQTAMEKAKKAEKRILDLGFRRKVVASK